MVNSYDVALWRYWPTCELPVVDVSVSAVSPLLAVLSLMDRYKLKRVAYAAVGLPDQTIKRWQSGLSLSYDEVPAEYTSKHLEAMP
jgi:hypothetical protein